MHLKRDDNYDLSAQSLAARINIACYHRLSDSFVDIILTLCEAGSSQSITIFQVTKNDR